MNGSYIEPKEVTEKRMSDIRRINAYAVYLRQNDENFSAFYDTIRHLRGNFSEMAQRLYERVIMLITATEAVKIMRENAESLEDRYEHFLDEIEWRDEMDTRDDLLASMRPF